jgi:signal transduction histidine kinase
VSQSSRNILAAYAMCMLLPSAATWGVVYPTQAIGVGALTILYCMVIILVAADGEKLLLRSVTIRHQRDQLVRDLEQRNSDVRVAMGEAEQSAKARARVLAAASHDLRQPLHALSVYSAVLASKPAPDLLNEVSVNIDQIVRALGNLLNGLLDLVAPVRRELRTGASAIDDGHADRRRVRGVQPSRRAKGSGAGAGLKTGPGHGGPGGARTHRAQSHRQRHQVHRRRARYAYSRAWMIRSPCPARFSA